MPNLNQLQMFKNLLKKVRQPTEQEVAHMIAQRHAAMPTAQGGLGLPPANKPMDRAAAMGYDLPAYRGTRADEAALYANTQQIPGKVRSGTGAFMSENPQLASTYAGNKGGNVMPVMVRSQGMPVVEAGGAPWSDIGGLDTNEIARRALAAGQPGVRFKNVADPGAHIRGVQNIPETANNLTAFNPADVRSRFAAFDPLKQHSEDLLHCEGGSIKSYAGGHRVLPKDQHMPSGALVDLAKRKAELEASGVPGVMYQAAKETYDNPIINNVLAALPVTGEAMLANDVANEWQKGNKWTAGGMGLAGMLPFGGMIGKTVWHGSPHPFNMFDMSKIGTGEGHQSYGVGHYLAEAKPTAQRYAEDLSNREAANQGRLNAHANAKRLANLAGDPKYAADDVRFVLESNPNHSQKELLTATLKHLESGSYKAPLKNEGYLYKVDLPDEHIEKMLDWDKPLSHQHPQIQEYLNSVRNELDESGNLADYLERKNADWHELTGAELYKQILNRAHMDDAIPKLTDMDERNWNRAASLYLKDKGLTGIKYLDQESRSANDGTRNFVSFYDEHPEILERNGQPLDTLK